MANVIGNLMDMLGGGGESRAQGIYGDIANQAKNIPLPVLKEYYPELYKQVVQLNPELDKAVNLGPSAMQDINIDPRLKSAQMNALTQLQDIGLNRGQTAQDKLNQAQAESDMNASVQGQTGAIQQNMATRGLSGGMSEMVSKQLAAQAGANRLADMGMQNKAQAENRALQAIQQSGLLGGQIGQQEFSQQAQQKAAQDAIARFNAQNQQGVNMQNTQNRNQAQQWNAVNAQQTANQNTGLGNQAQQYNLNLPQQQFQNQMSKFGVQAGAMGNQAQQQQQQAQNQRQFLGNLVSAGAGAYGASKIGK